VIRTTDDGDICTVAFDRPERRNALTPTALDALETAVSETDAPVVYLHGAGSAFCAGADFAAVADLAEAAKDGTTEPAAKFARQGQQVARTIEESDAVVVAGIDGAARGGGMELALACDIRIATPDVTFAEPGVTFGLFGAWGGTHRLPSVVGQGNAIDLTLSGRVINSDEALRMGLVSRVVANPQSVAEEIASADREALDRLKPLMYATDTESVMKQEEREVEAFAELIEVHAGELSTKNTTSDIE
jgi:enoyl-CoA hydratase